MEIEIDSYSSMDRRLNVHLVHGVILLAVFIIAAYKTWETDGQTMVMSLITMCLISSVFLMILLLCDVTLRICQTMVSLADAHNQSLATSFSYFSLNTASAATLLISVLLFLGLIAVIHKNPLDYIWDFGPYVCVPSIIFSFCLLRIVKLNDWETNLFFRLDHMKGLDCGTGMAYNYYYGYLRLILPSTGMINKGIIEKIENFEDNHNVTFPVHKIFILIPSSGYIPSDLKEVSYQWMERAQDLEEETRNRAGIIARKYHNSAYKIYPDGQKLDSPKYVVVEGATSLLTFYEIQKHNHPESNVYQKYKKDIIEMFYIKLREIVQDDPDMRDLCELIYYDDFDSHGAKVNVAKIILERISKIKGST
jgi:transmembrane protein 173